MGVAGEDDTDKTILFDEFKSKDTCYSTIYGNGRILNYNGYSKNTFVDFISLSNLTLRGANTDKEKDFTLDISIGNGVAKYVIFENFRKAWTGPTTTTTF